jgi:hypothetical protein
VADEELTGSTSVAEDAVERCSSPRERAQIGGVAAYRGVGHGPKHGIAMTIACAEVGHVSQVTEQEQTRSGRVHAPKLLGEPLKSVVRLFWVDPTKVKWMSSSTRNSRAPAWTTQWAPVSAPYSAVGDARERRLIAGARRRR